MPKDGDASLPAISLASDGFALGKLGSLSSVISGVKVRCRFERDETTVMNGERMETDCRRDVWEI